jgi:excisionase family DNA binding protein
LERAYKSPATQPRRALRRQEAAEYVGISERKFDELVADGRMPRPVRIGSRVVWDIRKIDLAFDDLADDDETSNPWDA